MFIHIDIKVKDEELIKIEHSDYILNHPAYKYALNVVSGESPAGEYIVKECKNFLEEMRKRQQIFPTFLQVLFYRVQFRCRRWRSRSGL